MHSRYFAAGGIALYLCDKWYGSVNSSWLFTPSSLTYAEETGISTMTIPRPAWLNVDAGQYFFVNIPQISLDQWHPISWSGSLNGDIVFRIKNQATTSSKSSSLQQMFSTSTTFISHSNNPVAALPRWSEAFAIIADSARFQRMPMPVVRLHGPFGHSPFHEYDALLLFAGGIGITPIMSLVIDLFINVHQGIPIRPQQVVLVWMAQQVDLFFMYADVFNAIANLQKSAEYPVFIIKLFCTRGGIINNSSSVSVMHSQSMMSAPLLVSSRDISDSSSGSYAGPQDLPIGSGISLDYSRCNFPELFESFSRSRSTLAAVCGPPQMAQEVSVYAKLFDCEFHSEEFTF